MPAPGRCGGPLPARSGRAGYTAAVPRRRSPLRVALYLAVILGTAGVAGFLALSEGLYRGGLASVEDEAAELRAQRFSDPDALRLLFVGDSFTAGVVDPAGTWTDFLVDELARQGFAHPVEVINIGFAGSDTGWHVAQVRRWLAAAELPPVHTSLITGANNAGTYAWQAAFLDSEGARTAPATLRAVYRLPRSTVFGAELIANLLRGEGNLSDDLPLPDAEHLDVGLMRGRLEAASDFLPWTAARKGALLDDYVAVVRAAGAEPLLGTYITEGEYETNDSTRAAAARHGVALFDVASPDRHADFHRTGGYLEDDWHLSEAGQRRFAALWVGWYLREVEGAP